VERYRDPARRYGDHARSGNDALIVHPRRLDKERAVSLCGQCHGQRLPLDVAQLAGWLTRGPSFRSGERLVDHARPLAADTPSPTERDPDLFRLRFWPDGTPRLTAYEYQGVVLSPCYLKGEMTCESCHVMHGGDPRGMIEPRMRGDDACLQCHADIARDVRKHTKHDPQRSGSACMDCHMPRMVYGILTIHRSHRIENPDPARDAEAGRPHACTMCHLDRSLVWSAQKMAEWWGEEYRIPERRLDGAPPELADGLASLLAGDAVQRAVYAAVAGRGEVALEPPDKAFVRVGLAATVADAYPSIRWLARRSLLALEDELPLGLAPRIAAWDPTDHESRSRFAELLLAEIAARGPGRLRLPAAAGPLLVNDDLSPDLPALVGLLELQEERVISIGE
jgi:predicted CXXCH cytochrome family protein